MIKLEKTALFILALLALFYIVSGIALFVMTKFTYNMLPDYYGDFNNHFIKDAGLAFLSSGIMFAISLFQSQLRITLAMCGSFFVVLHGMFHIQMIASGMVPVEFYGYELLQIIIPAILSLVVVFTFIQVKRVRKI